MTDDELLTECAMKVKPELWGGQSRGPYKGVTVLHVDYMNRRKQLINEPDDADAADTPARYKTQDANGEWWWHDTMPYIIEEHAVWDSDGWQTLSTRGKVPAGHDWRNTLREVTPMTTTPNAPTWPRHPAHKAHKPELNPTCSSLTDSQARQFAEESGTCSDGTPCGELRVYGSRYCSQCPNMPDETTRKQIIDRCNATLAFWPADAEAAGQIMPVDFPWRWKKDDDGQVTLMNKRALIFVTEADWCAGEDLSNPQCLHYGGECGESGYCAPCPNRPQPGYKPEDVAFKQPRIDTGAHYRYQYKARITPTDIERGYVVVNLDPYRIAGIYALGGGPREHATKKLLRGTSKGEDQHQVIQQVRDALDRWEEMLDEDAAR